MDVDPLDAAAALARVEAGAVDQAFDGLAEVGILAHIGRVFAAELQIGRDEGFCRRRAARHAHRDRARERHQLGSTAGHDPQRRGVLQMQVLEHAGWQARQVERLLEPLGAQRGLRRVLEQHDIARGQSRDDAVDGGQVRIVPGRHDEYQA